MYHISSVHWPLQIRGLVPCGINKWMNTCHHYTSCFSLKASVSCKVRRIKPPLPNASQDPNRECSEGIAREDSSRHTSSQHTAGLHNWQSPTYTSVALGDFCLTSKALCIYCFLWIDHPVVCLGSCPWPSRQREGISCSRKPSHPEDPWTLL